MSSPLQYAILERCRALRAGGPSLVLRRLGALMLFALWSGQAAAWPPAALLDGSRINMSSEQTGVDYHLVTGDIKKINNRWRMEDQLVLTGQVQRTTYEVAEDVSFRTAQAQLLRSLAPLPTGSVLYRCEGLDCGSSNGWAIQVFQRKQLYGLDSDQFYAALQLPAAAGERAYAAVYLVQRGNRRIYLQIDTVRIPADDPMAAAAAALADAGFWILPSNDLSQLSESELAPLVQLLKDSADLELRLVAHDSGPGDAAARLQRAAAAATAAASRLQTAGAPQLTAYGIGDLAPRPGAPAQRLELVRVISTTQ